MRTSVKYLVALLLTLAPVVAEAQGVGYCFRRFDIDADTVLFGELRGQNNNPFSGAIRGPSNVETSGSSLTVTGVSPTTTAAFAGIDVGDVLTVTKLDGTTDVRFVATNADDDTVTVDDEVDWSNGTTGLVFRYWKSITCTNNTCGWMNVSSGRTTEAAPMICSAWERGDLATSADVVYECRGAGADEPIQVYPATAGTYTAFALAGVGTTAARHCLSLDSTKFRDCRVGVKRTGADTADVVGTSTEIFTAWVEK